MKIELINTLAQALRGNEKLQRLDIITVSRSGGQSVVTLPVPELTGAGTEALKRVDLSTACQNGTLNRVTCGIIGARSGVDEPLCPIDEPLCPSALLTNLYALLTNLSARMPY